MACIISLTFTTVASEYYRKSAHKVCAREQLAAIKRWGGR
jgi:hypothetical protein